MVYTVSGVLNMEQGMVVTSLIFWLLKFVGACTINQCVLPRYLGNQH